MSQTATRSATQTYTATDIQKVVRRFRADIMMIAQSTGALTEAKALNYAHDMDVLAGKGFLKKVDVTQLRGTEELCAAVYTVNTAAGGLVASNPGDVLWEEDSTSHIRLVVSYTDAFNDTERHKLNLKINWTPTSADTSHSSLKARGTRDYVSNGWGLQREDYKK